MNGFDVMDLRHRPHAFIVRLGAFAALMLLLSIILEGGPPASPVSTMEGRVPALNLQRTGLSETHLRCRLTKRGRVLPTSFLSHYEHRNRRAHRQLV